MRRHPQEDVRPATVVGPSKKEAERVLRQVERNLTTLTHPMLMAEIEELPPTMQPHVVGVPRTWVQLFWHLANSIVNYTRVNIPRP
jgi:hypothetical protein